MCTQHSHVDRGNVQMGKVSVPAPQPERRERLNQRTAFAGAAAMVLALAGLTLWSAQAWR